jgi:putative glutamine amidotransferase
MKKKLGISYCENNFQNYWNWFTAADLKKVELVELSFQKNNVEDIQDCDGFILTGGVDVDPALYGESIAYPNAPAEFRTERDRFEEKIFLHAQENKLPLLGICRGMQLVNVLQGGKLVQDLGERPNRIHRKKETDKQHEIRIEKQSLLFQVTRLAIGKVNSAHHQAVRVDALGKNLKINAWSESEDSVPEGLEYEDKTGKGFMLCVQWHPERMLDKENNPASVVIKETFLREITKQSK